MKSKANPLFDALQGYTRQGNIPFHTPGHKGRGVRGIDWTTLDLSELPGLDDLHDPTEAIHEAQLLASRAFGAQNTFFLVNGSSVGNLAMVLAACNHGDTLLVPRNCHRSILSGAILAGANLHFIPTVWDPRLGTYHGVTPEAVQNSIQRHPEAKAVLVVSPTYLGVSSDLARIAEAVHASGLVLLVDEAHGAHLHFHSAFAPTAMTAGADAAVQSTHKTLGAFTQAAMLHHQGDILSVERLKQALSLLQSTSPSYPLLASLDLARSQAEEGSVIRETLSLAHHARSLIRNIPGMNCLGTERTGEPGIAAIDPTKLVIDPLGIGLFGDQALDLLEEQHIILEMATPGSMLAMVTVGSVMRDIDRLVEALHRLPGGDAISLDIPEPPLAPRALPIGEAAWAKNETVSLQDAVGRISAETVAPCPPGIPLLTPGDRITSEVAALLQKEFIRVI